MSASHAEPTTKRSSWFPWRTSLKHEHPALRQANDARTLGERVADNIASFGGSWPFIFIFLGIIVGWMVVNTLLIQDVIGGKPFDPYPYIALNLLLSALAGLQAPIIMMSQNRAAARDEILAQHHYEETQKIDQLLTANTDLTQQVHDLTEKVHMLTQRICEVTPGLSSKLTGGASLADD
jgi:uncharacterized membrane protein